MSQFTANIAQVKAGASYCCSCGLPEITKGASFKRCFACFQEAKPFCYCGTCGENLSAQDRKLHCSQCLPCRKRVPKEVHPSWCETHQCLHPAHWDSDSQS